MLKRAADLAEALYSMPGNRGALPQSRSPPMNTMTGYNGYSSQLSVADQDGQWKDGKSEMNHTPAVT